MKRLVIVGGVAGGASAAARARRLSEDCDVTRSGSRTQRKALGRIGEDRLVAASGPVGACQIGAEEGDTKFESAQNQQHRHHQYGNARDAPERET